MREEKRGKVTSERAPHIPLSLTPHRTCMKYRNLCTASSDPSLFTIT